MKYFRTQKTVVINLDSFNHLESQEQQFACMNKVFVEVYQRFTQNQDIGEIDYSVCFMTSHTPFSSRLKIGLWCIEFVETSPYQKNAIISNGIYKFLCVVNYSEIIESVVSILSVYKKIAAFDSWDNIPQYIKNEILNNSGIKRIR